MAPRPEGSPVSTPRTRSPVKGVRTGGVTCSGPDALSMLSMLAEVASVTLHTDPSVTDTALAAKTKASNSGNRKPSEYEVLTLEQVSNMTDNLLVKLFSEFESNEMWRRFTYTCRMLPAACSQFFQSFGSEHKARAGMKAHLLSHLKSLLEVHTNEQSRQNYILESVPARKRRLCEQESSATKRRGASVNSRTSKPSANPKTPTRGGENSRSRKTVHITPEKENDNKRKIGVISKEFKKTEVATSFLQADNIKKENKSLLEIPRNETKPKRKLETSRDSRTRAKKMKAIVSEGPLPSDDLNNNNNNNSADVKEEVKTELEEDSPPMQQAVSHDHGYLKANPSQKAEPTTCRTFTPNEHYSSEESQQGHHQQLPQVSGIVEESAGISMSGKEIPSHEDHSTLLHEHMNQELQGGIMAQDSGSSSTPLPVVGCEVEFTPDQQYKVMRSDLPVVYDHNNPPSNIQTVSRIIERDEYKVRKKPKGRAKFIGQSKVEKEMALKLITEIRSLPVMALDTLECKICHPPRLFTAPSTLLSHYRSHAGIRPYECRICEAVFTRQHSLNYHMLIHTNQTRFTCVDCGRKFRHPSHFKEHRRRHTGESPYECSDCLMRFKTRNTYKRHLRTRHGKLLTTQGAIIILSQEEADRMKKTQGRKPRRPRQPLQIISPEAAAQMEEEQIWTDFEEGEREEEEEEEDDDDEEEEEEDEASQLENTHKRKEVPKGNGVNISTSGIVSTVGVQQIANGKTGLFIRPKKISVSKSKGKSNVDKAKVPDQSAEMKVEIQTSEDSFLEEERVEEEVVTEEVNMDDLRTYVFQPPPEHNTLPKVNIRSSWNTINIDLKDLEKATENVVTETIPENESELTTFENSQIIAQVPEQVMNQASEECTDFTSDNVLPEEVITICAGEENTGDNIPTTGNQSNGGTQGGKPDWFTVKKPLKCYGRPSYSILEPNANVFSAGGPASGTNKPNPQTNPSGRWVYLVEYIQGQDGRLAKVYRGSASLVNRSNQNLGMEVPASSSGNVMTKAPVNRDNAKVTVMSSTVTNPPPAVFMSKAPGKLVMQAENREHVKSSSTSGSSTVPSHILSKPNNQSTHDASDRVVINKQVVNNVVVNNHIVKNGSIVSVSCGEHNQMPLNCSPQPVVLAAGPVSSSSSEHHLRSQGHQILPTQNLAGKSQGLLTTGTNCQEVTHTLNGNPKDQVFGGHSVNHLVTVGDDVLLENVEIIESMDTGTPVDVTVTGIIESDSFDQQQIPGGEYNSKSQIQVPRRTKLSPSNVSNTSRVKVEEVRHGDSPLVETGGELMDNFLNQHSENQGECELSSSPNHRTSTQASKIVDVPQASPEQVSSIHGINSIATMSSSNLLPAAVQI